MHKILRRKKNEKFYQPEDIAELSEETVLRERYRYFCLKRS